MLSQLVEQEDWRALREIQNFHNRLPEETYDILRPCASEVTLWETAYYHVVDSHAAVIAWHQGSGLRPYLDCLSEAERPRFLAVLEERLKAVFPVQRDGRILLKMPRFFFLATR